jgi:hypothetical protein
MMMIFPSEKSEVGTGMPDAESVAVMMKYNESLAKAGVLLTLDGLHPTAKGARVTWDETGRPIVTDGPFAETREIIGGYWMLQVKSREEAIEWSRRFPNPTIDGSDCEIEVRQLFGLEDFGESEALDRFREIGLVTQR